jgi:phage replication O-like protein O
MASPQKENGYTPIANELFEAFYRCKLLEYERVCVMHIWRKTYGWAKREDWIANSQFAIETGIPRPHITRTLRNLLAKKLVVRDSKMLTVNKNYEEWEVEWRKLPHQVTGVTSPGNKKLPHQVPTKEKKETTTKTISKQSLQLTSSMENLIPEVIKLFETVDPKNKTYYGNKTQRGACLFLLEEYGLEEIKKRIEVLPATNTLPYFPSITTPCQLRDKWVVLDNQIKRHKTEQTIKNNAVAF